MSDMKPVDNGKCLTYLRKIRTARGLHVNPLTRDAFGVPYNQSDIDKFASEPVEVFVNADDLESMIYELQYYRAQHAQEQ